MYTTTQPCSSANSDFLWLPHFSSFNFNGSGRADGYLAVVGAWGALWNIVLCSAELWS